MISPKAEALVMKVDPCLRSLHIDPTFQLGFAQELDLQSDHRHSISLNKQLEPYSMPIEYWEVESVDILGHMRHISYLHLRLKM